MGASTVHEGTTMRWGGEASEAVKVVSLEKKRLKMVDMEDDIEPGNMVENEPIVCKGTRSGHSDPTTMSIESVETGLMV